MLFESLRIEIQLLFGDDLEIFRVGFVCLFGWEVVKEILKFHLFRRAVVLIDGFSNFRLTSQQRLDDFTPSPKPKLIQHDNIVRITQGDVKHIPRAFNRHHLIPDNTVARQELHNIRFDLA